MIAGPNILTFDHTCSCVNCAPEKFPRGPRQNEGHVGWRFGDETQAIWWAATVYLDGEPEWHAVEACPGRDGYIVRAAAYSVCPNGEHDPKTCCSHLCRNCGSDRLCLEVKRGNVVVMYQRFRVPILAGARAV